MDAIPNSNPSQEIDAFVEAVDKFDARLVALQKELCRQINDGLPLSEVRDGMGPRFDGVDLESFLAADTMDKRLQWALENTV